MRCDYCGTSSFAQSAEGVMEHFEQDHNLPLLYQKLDQYRAALQAIADSADPAASIARAALGPSEEHLCAFPAKQLVMVLTRAHRSTIGRVLYRNLASDIRVEVWLPCEAAEDCCMDVKLIFAKEQASGAAQ